MKRALAVLVAVLAATAGHAQFNGHNFRGDFGVQSGSQAPPGTYVLGMYLRYDGDELRDRNGNAIRLDPEGRGELDVGRS